MGRKQQREINGIRVDGLSSKGMAVGRHEGEVIFFKGAVPGDVVDLRVFRKKKSFSEAAVTNLVEPSSKRVDPKCIYFGTCGGCKWQNVDYSLQLTEKEKQVSENFKKIGKVISTEIEPILPSSNIYFYRNKLEFTFSNKRWLTKEEIDSGKDLKRNGLGFHIPGMFDKILDIEECLLQAGESNAIRNFVRTYAEKESLAYYDVRQHTGLLRNLIIRTANTGDLMVILQVAEPKTEVIEQLLENLQRNFPSISSLFYIVNTKKNDSYADQIPIYYGGEKFIVETMKDPKTGKEIKFQVGPKSFYQTNSHQAERLYQLVYEMADLSTDNIVYDLYTGTGTIANYIASSCKKVIGIEYVEEAVQDARVNTENNGHSHLSFHSGDIKDLLDETFFDAHGRPDVIITDPPRAGMHEDVTKQILKAAPEKIVYVSCNSATQARDIELLSEKYEVVRIRPVDMFPQTPHVENVCLLKLKKGE